MAQPGLPAVLLSALLGLAACENPPDARSDAGGGGDARGIDAALDLKSPDGSLADAPDAGADSAPDVPARSIKVVFVIAMENRDDGEIYGDTDAPYINGTLMPAYARANDFHDELPSLLSEPHYVWMEAGTNVFADHTFGNDDPPSASNSTGSSAHLVRQLEDAGGGATWMAYQEGINATTGACPIAAAGFYWPKHDPFVFFRDVSGSPPSKTNPYCIAHHKPLAALAGDLGAGTVATYNFITPDQCHDMHGQGGCPGSNPVRAGDAWLAATMPALISYAGAHDGVIFIVWDEGNATSRVPFLAVGPGVKRGYAGGIAYDHGALLKSLSLILGVPPLPTVSAAPDLSDLFEPGAFP